ncbi:MAG TPA: NAD(P)H-dependent glycerol-3-phosphate dehydrogenase [Opitutus sp.]|nr:NAD(P)H-dependent glycerol-3-phosphate dehydrogenase [Opitutus sp.]
MNFVVVGAGAWGTAFAVHLARLGRTVTLVPRRSEQAAKMAVSRENDEYLPGIALPTSVRIQHGFEAMLGAEDVVLLACPSQALRETCAKVRGSRQGAAPKLVVSLAKGLEIGTHLRPSQIIAETFPGGVAGSLTGPTNAAEVARGLPAAMVLGVARFDAAVQEVQAALSGPTLRVYTSDDVAGVEFGGCLKNIYAIAAGCSDGLELGDNTRAALLTRALAEMVRVGTALGARAETFFGLSGFGDLVATCHGEWSRNRQFGEQIGRGRAVVEWLQERKSVVEGYKTTQSFHELCLQKGIDAPILRETHAILYEGKRPGEALKSLMTRGLKSETR